jgi:putative component of membrane protein insertase Oxa1/YidC/SpoIIIJ protein YidD
MMSTILSSIIKSLRSLLGPEGCCRYELPCTDFAALQLRDHTFLKALCAITLRVLSCNPLTQFFIG